MGRQWRQRPIACQSCRRRKIRCTREFPCSNCTSRGLRCVQFYKPQESEPEPGPGPGPEPVLNGESETRAAGVNMAIGMDMEMEMVSKADIQARLDRLETWVTGLTDPGAASSLSRTSTGEMSEPAQLSRRAQPLSPPLSSTVQHLSQDALWFGGNFLCQKAKYNTSDGGLLDVGLSYHLSPIKLIKKPYSIVQDATSSSGGREVCLTLPPYHEALVILRTFTEESALLSPIIHGPSLLVSIQSIYASVQRQAAIDREHLLLFLSIIASVTYACSSGDDISKLFSSHVEANAQCETWVTASFALSDELKRRGKSSMLCLQGQNVLFKVASYMEGSSVRTRSLISTSITTARDLGFHRIDLPGDKIGRRLLGSDMDVEIARRLWWDLVIIDWLFALFPGSHEGVYTIHPQHMAVNRPRMISDGDHVPAAQKREQPSDLSYFLERIRLAELGRKYIDCCPLSRANTDAAYQDLLRYDKSLEQYQLDLPPFFSVSNLYDPVVLQTHESTSLVVQRIQINCMVYLMRCIMHLQYLSLSTLNPKYAPSRKVCFACASDIVRLHKQVRRQYPHIIPRLKALTTFLRALILASAVFLLDVCSGTEIRDLSSERPDMLDAWRALGDFQRDSYFAEQFFEFAGQMLKKYGVSTTIVAALESQLPGDRDGDGDGDGEGAHEAEQTTQHVVQMYEDGGAKDMGVGMMDTDQRWQTLDADFDLKTMSWDNVLWWFDAVLM